MIISDCLFTINNPILVEVNGKISKIFVVEETQIHPHKKEPGKSEVTGNGVNSSDQNLSDDDKIEDDDGGDTSAEESDHDITRLPLMSDQEDGGKEKTGSPIISLGTTQNTPIINSSPIRRPPKYPSSNDLLGNRSPANSPINSNISQHLSISPIKNSLPSLENLKFSPPKTLLPTKLQWDPRLSPSPKNDLCGPKNSSPYRNQTLPVSNTFSPLARKPPSKPSSKQPSSSSSISGPSIPPGFENFISPSLKAHNDRKKFKKHQKRKEKKRAFMERITSQSTPTFPNHKPKPPHDKTASEIIELGLQLGMEFNGPLSELHDKIMGILCHQQDDWRNAL